MAKVGAIVLAAGRSRRMGGPNKLVAELDGKPVIRHVIDTLEAARIAPVTVVTGHEAVRIHAALAGRDVAFVHNGRFSEGLGTSLKAGLAALGNDVDAALVCLGDMPAVSAESLSRLVEAHDPAAGRCIAVPTCGGRRGNPVLWDRRFFEPMQDVAGDSGARRLIRAYRGLVAEVALEDDGVLFDIDTPAALSRAAAGRAGPCR